MEVANLNFWCSSSFCVFSSGVTAEPHQRPGCGSLPIKKAFSCTCPLLPSVWLCGATAGQRAIKADASSSLTLRSWKKKDFNESIFLCVRLEVESENEIQNRSFMDEKSKFVALKKLFVSRVRRFWLLWADTQNYLFSFFKCSFKLKLMIYVILILKIHFLLLKVRIIIKSGSFKQMLNVLSPAQEVKCFPVVISCFIFSILLPHSTSKTVQTRFLSLTHLLRSLSLPT